MMENGRSTAAYVRVSSDKQDTARQEKRIFATGLPIAFWFRDSIGKNPRDLPEKREAFQAMLKAVEAGLVDRIVVDRQDRFGVARCLPMGQVHHLASGAWDHACRCRWKGVVRRRRCFRYYDCRSRTHVNARTKRKGPPQYHGQSEQGEGRRVSGRVSALWFDVVCFGATA